MCYVCCSKDAAEPAEEVEEGPADRRWIVLRGSVHEHASIRRLLANANLARFGLCTESGRDTTRVLWLGSSAANGDGHPGPMPRSVRSKCC